MQLWYPRYLLLLLREFHGVSSTIIVNTEDHGNVLMSFINIGIGVHGVISTITVNIEDHKTENNTPTA